MSRSPSFASRATAALLSILLMVQGSGCHKWKVTPQPWPVHEEQKAPDRYRVTRSDGVRFEAQTVRVSGDTLYATGLQALPADSTLGAWVPTPFSEVVYLEGRYANPRATIALVAVGVLTVGAVIALAVAAASMGPFLPCPGC